MDTKRRFNRLRWLGAAVPVGLLAACAQMPTGPSVAVMPPAGKPLEVFSAEDQACRAYAAQVVGPAGNDVAAANVAGSAAIGTVVGAAAGALIGGHNGAGVGAGIGLLGGTAVGAQNGAYAGASMQQRYDIAYQQCMYTKGNVLPSYGRYYWRRGYGYVYAPGYAAPAPATPPPPPPPPPPAPQ
jgi:hypothetical protein